LCFKELNKARRDGYIFGCYTGLHRVRGEENDTKTEVPRIMKDWAGKVWSSKVGKEGKQDAIQSS
jgi:hypothetical protein